MDRATGARLEPEAYRHAVEIASRFDDLDSLGHINNISLTRIVEDARFRWLVNLGVTIGGPAGHGPGLNGGRFVIAATQQEYLAEAFYPEPISVRLATLGVGRTSWTIGHLALQRERRVCVGQTVLVLVSEQGFAKLDERFRSMAEAQSLVGS